MLPKSYGLVVLAAAFCLLYAMLPLALADSTWMNASWSGRKVVTFNETVGYDRTNEYTDFNVSFSQGLVQDCGKEIRVSELRQSVNVTNLTKTQSNRLFYETFENGNNGWNVSGTASISTSRYKSGTHSAYLPRGGSTPTALINKNFSAPAEDYVVAAWVYPTSTGSGSGAHFFSMQESNIWNNWRGPDAYSSSGYLYWYDANGARSTTYTIPTDGWMYMRAVLDVDAGTYDFYADTTDGTQIRIGKGRFRNFADASNRTLFIQSYTDSSDTMSFYIDDITIAPKKITVDGLKKGQKVELYDQNGVEKSECIAVDTSCSIDAYMLVFPFGGYVKIYDTDGTLAYTSQNYTDIFGGDTFSVVQTSVDKEVEVPFRINYEEYTNSTASSAAGWKTLTATDLNKGWKYYEQNNNCNGPSEWTGPWSISYDNGWTSVDLSDESNWSAQTNYDRFYRKWVYVDGQIDKATITFGSNDGGQVWVNDGTSWGTSNSWSYSCHGNNGNVTSSNFDIKNNFRPGWNLITVHVTQGSTANSQYLKVTDANITFRTNSIRPFNSTCTKADITVPNSLRANSSAKYYVYYGNPSATQAKYDVAWKEYMGVLPDSVTAGISSSTVIMSNPTDHQVNFTLECYGSDGTHYGPWNNTLSPKQTLRTTDWISAFSSRCGYQSAWTLRSSDSLVVFYWLWDGTRESYVQVMESNIMKGHEFRSTGYSLNNVYSDVNFYNPSSDSATINFECWSRDNSYYPSSGAWTTSLASGKTKNAYHDLNGNYIYSSCNGGSGYEWRMSSTQDIIVSFDEWDVWSNNNGVVDQIAPLDYLLGKEFRGTSTSHPINPENLYISNPGGDANITFECWRYDGNYYKWSSIVYAGRMWRSQDNIGNLYTSCGSNYFQWKLTSNSSLVVRWGTYDGTDTDEYTVPPVDKVAGKEFWFNGYVESNLRGVIANPQSTSVSVDFECWYQNGSVRNGTWSTNLNVNKSTYTYSVFGNRDDLYNLCGGSYYLMHANSSLPIVLSMTEWGGNERDTELLRASKPKVNVDVTSDIMVVYGNAELLQNGSIKINQYGRDWLLPASWSYEWNQTDSVYAGEQYYLQKRITYNSSFSFAAAGSPYFRITGWVLNGNATCAKFMNGTYSVIAQNCTANMSGVLGLGSNYVYLDQSTINRSSDVLWDDKMTLAVPLPIKEISRRQDFSQTTVVNGLAYSLLQFNVTNNASAYNAAANFTNLIIKQCPAGFNCTGFTQMLDLGESATGWSWDTDGETVSTSPLKREGSYALNLTWRPDKNGLPYANFFDSTAGSGNLTDFSVGNMSLWLFVSNKSNFNSVAFGLGSDSTHWKRWQKQSTAMSDGWNYITIDLASAPSDSGSAIDWNNINYLDVYVDGTVGTTSWILTDDWRVWSKNMNFLRLLSMQSNNTVTEYRLLKNNAIVGVNGANNDWTQDVSQITTANGSAYIKGNLKSNNTDSIDYWNVTLPANQPDQSRSGWTTCTHLAREIYIMNSSVYTSTDNPITCNKSNVIAKNDGVSWMQKGAATLSSQTINRTVTVANGDTIPYANVAWSTGSDASCWLTSHINDTVALIVAGGNSTVEATQSGDCIGNSSSAWKQYMESDETGQYIHQNLTPTNSANTPFSVMLYPSDFGSTISAFTPVGAYSDPSDYNSPVALGAGQTTVKRQVKSADILSQTNYDASQGNEYVRFVNVTCNADSSTCNMLSNVKLTVSVNDVNYTDFKVFRKISGNWNLMTIPSVSGGTATWYTSSFGATEEYKVWGNNTSGQPPGGGGGGTPSVPSITITSPQSQTYSSGSIWANVTTNISVDWCKYSLNGSANQSMSNTSLISWYNSMSLADGAYSIKFYCNNAGAVGESAERIFTVDSSLPTVTILSPTSVTYNRNSNIQLTFTVSVQPNATWYTVDGGSPVYAGNTTFGVGGDGAHNVTVYANDSLNKVGSAVMPFSTDATAPIVTIVSPLAQNYSTGVWFNATLNETGSWCGYSLDGAANVTMAGSGTAFGAQNSSALTIGTHAFIIYCNDAVGNTGSASGQFNFSQTAPDTTPPVVTLISPVNGTAYTTSSSVALTYSVDEPSTCAYSLNGGSNTSISGNTSFSPGNANHNITLYCTDNSSNTGKSATVLFSVSYTAPTPPSSPGGGGGGGAAAPPANVTVKKNVTAGTIILGITADPASLSMAKDGTAKTTLKVSNDGTGTADVTLTATGVPADWISGLKALSIGNNEFKEVELSVTGKESGNWTLTVTAAAGSNSTNSKSVSIPLTVTSATGAAGTGSQQAGPTGAFSLNLPAVSTEMLMVGGLGIVVLAAIGVFAGMMKKD